MAKKVKIKDESSAIKYLKHVLKNWPTFCDEHKKMAQSIKILIEAKEK